MLARIQKRIEELKREESSWQSQEGRSAGAAIRIVREELARTRKELAFLEGLKKDLSGIETAFKQSPPEPGREAAIARILLGE